MFPMGKGVTIYFDFHIFKSPVAFAAFRMRNLCRLGQRNGSFRVAGCAGCPLPFMTFEAGLFRRTKSGGVMGVVIDIVMAGSAGILQLLDMEMVRNRDTVRVEIRGSLLDIKNTLMAPDTIGIDLIEFGGKTGVFPFTFQGKDVDARHQGMSGGMTFRTVDFRVEG